MRSNHDLPRGQVITLQHTSAVLQGNPLGDPHVRELQVWLPPGYRAQGRRRYPVLYDLTGYTGSGPAHTNWKNFGENVPERLDRLHAEGRIGGVLVVFPDCFTALGGNQYINSSAIGRYADYLTRELVPFVDASLNTKPHRDHRACFGKSSGGYGAMVHGALHSDTWGAIGNHSGDAYFDFVYRAEWPAVLTHLANFAPKLTQKRQDLLRRGQDDGRIRRFLDAFQSKQNPTGRDIMTLMMVCMAATYDPDPRAPNRFRVPFNMHTGEFLESRWKRWLAHDPLNLVAKHRASYKSLRGIYIDCGRHDQYHIHFGSRQLSDTLGKHNVRHRYEEFNGTHSGIDHRMDVSLPYLYRAIR